MAQFRRKSACHLKYPSDLIAPPAAPGKLLLIPVKPSFFPVARFCVRADARHTACEDHVFNRNQEIIRDTDGNRLGRVYRKYAAPKFATAQPNVICRSAKRAKFNKHLVPGGQTDETSKPKSQPIVW